MNTQEANNRSLEELENDFWNVPSEFPTKLVESVFLLRRKPIYNLDANEIRILLSQNVGLKYIVPLAISLLNRNVYEEALYYPGDLLLTLLKVEESFWLKNIQQKNELIKLINKKRPNIIKSDILDEDIKNEILDKFQKLVV
ncbi:contact-dependent growth inhibition system immunity protein [Flavisolibacter nicotianae]|uniref:contact-dependent growth inhibition system immunity protein n=1 Tax=Flavisolibacter nicotianae TaxID=2364882 RepID=UPI000EB0CD69|nr:contact-dependent growth inhibition system immunity protein [Flavisolibacter nicotianae]